MEQSSANQKKRVLIFIVTYNAERTLTNVLRRIPSEVFSDPRFDAEILVIDDNSHDTTFDRGLDFREKFTACRLTLLKNPVNLGYGGNQKVGYRYALDHGFSVVALLHGDGQYAPEELPRLLEPLLTGESDAVFGSRMMPGTDARKGGMPLYKYVGNIVLSFLQNRLVGMQLSEWHSGYRLYSCDFLRKVPFERNSDGFDFDTDIIIQLRAARGKIVELPIPTFYGDEICHVNGVQYSCKILTSCILFRTQQLGIFYDPKFDLEFENLQYQGKFSFESSHSLALTNLKAQESCLIVGCGPLELIRPFLQKAGKVSIVDMFVGPELRSAVANSWDTDLDEFDLQAKTEGLNFDKVLALDIIEHLRSPEKFLEKLRRSDSCYKSEILITTPNVAFLPLRIMLLLGFFNYGKRGILDRTHMRLFTYASLQRALLQAGFEVLEMRGIPAPYPLGIGDTWLSRLLLKINSLLCRVLPGLFSFQVFARARAKPSVELLLREAQSHGKSESARRQS